MSAGSDLIEGVDLFQEPNSRGGRLGGLANEVGEVFVVEDIPGTLANFEALVASAPRRFASGLGVNITFEQRKKVEGLYKDLVSYDLDPEKKIKKKVDYDSLKVGLDKVVTDLAGDRVVFDDYYSNNVFLRRNLQTAQGILSLGDEHRDVREAFLLKYRKLNDDFAASGGKMTGVQYVNNLHGIVSKSVKDSGDSKLQARWAAYESEGLVYVDTSTNVERDKHGALRVRQPREVEAVLRQGGTGVDAFVFTMRNDASAEVAFGDELSVSVNVYKMDTGEYLFYLNDEYTDEPLAVDPGYLADALDARHVDSYLSRKLLENLPGFSDSPANLPDEDMVTLAHKLIGDPVERNYKISEKDRGLLDGLAKVLANDNGKSLYVQVSELNSYMVTESNAAAVRRKLVGGGAGLTVTALLT